MKVIKTDGTKRVYVFEDGTEVSFDDHKEYYRKKISGISNQSRPAKPVREKKVSDGETDRDSDKSGDTSSDKPVKAKLGKGKRGRRRKT